MRQKKLKIGILASNVIRIPPIPPEKYVPPGWSGAPELIVHFITEELVKRGHRVYLFASGDTKTSAKLISVTKESSFLANKLKQHENYEYLLISKAFQIAEKENFEIIHSHFDIKSAHFAVFSRIPTISTLHSPLSGTIKEVLEHYKNTQYYASISNNQRKSLPDLKYAVTAYNGLEVEKIPFSIKKEDYLVFAGRLVKEKGLAEAIKVAKKANCRLFIFGSSKEDDYWINQVKPFIDNKRIIYKGMVKRKVLFDYLKKAKAFIFPLQWEEPFGLVAVEAMAAGTPVIAFNRGSLPEIVENGKSGFIVESIDEMAEAIKKLKTINPIICRKRAENLFSIEKMVDRYEQAYYEILGLKNK